MKKEGPFRTQEARESVNSPDNKKSQKTYKSITFLQPLKELAGPPQIEFSGRSGSSKESLETTLCRARRELRLVQGVRVQLRALPDRSRARIGLHECRGLWGATVTRMDASGQTESSQGPTVLLRKTEAGGNPRKTHLIGGKTGRGSCSPAPREQSFICQGKESKL